jgi:hypothetical protein
MFKEYLIVTITMFKEYHIVTVKICLTTSRASRLTWDGSAHPRFCPYTIHVVVQCRMNIQIYSDIRILISKYSIFEYEY